LRKSQETIGPNVDTPATTEFNAFHDVHQMTWQISSNTPKIPERMKATLSLPLVWMLS
jgi:hypothetical protein